MPTERWDDERLDRLANAVEANRIQTEVNTANIADLTRGLGALIQAIEEDRKDMRGLQFEVRRLVEELRQNRGEQ